MCGRFAQSQTREEYLAYLAEEAERDIAFDPEPIGRYNVAPGTPSPARWVTLRIRGRNWLRLSKAYSFDNVRNEPKAVVDAKGLK